MERVLAAQDISPDRHAVKGTPQEITIDVFEGDFEKLTDTVTNVIQFLNGLLVKVPEEFRADACISVYTDNDCEGVIYRTTYVYYTRMETQEEADAREAETTRRRTDMENSARQQELDTLARLKAKYPEAI